GVEALLAERDAREVEPGAEPAGVDELAERGGDPPTSEVLQAPDETAVERFQAGVDERFLHDRVAELDRPSGLRLAPVGDLLRGERDAADAIPAGAASDQDQEVPHRSRPVRQQPAARQEPNAADVDERVDD